MKILTLGLKTNLIEIKITENVVGRVIIHAKCNEFEFFKRIDL